MRPQATTKSASPRGASDQTYASRNGEILGWCVIAARAFKDVSPLHKGERVLGDLRTRRSAHIDPSRSCKDEVDCHQAELFDEKARTAGYLTHGKRSNRDVEILQQAFQQHVAMLLCVSIAAWTIPNT